MATLDRLPAKAYIPPLPAQVHRRRRSLNTIIEDEDEASKVVEQYSADWFSPMSDHFPTPRGNHFMPAPIMPPSPSSASESDYSQRSSAIWNRDSFATQTTEVVDIYDVSSDEEGQYKRKNTRLGVSRTASKASRRLSTISNRLSVGSNSSRVSLPALVIPAADKQNTPLIKFSSPVPPTPPPKIPMSPAVLKYLTSQEVLSSSATPSLDGSLSSEQLAAMSAPATPCIGTDDRDGNNWGGIELQPDAMATLQALSGDDPFDQQVETVLEISEMSPTTEMQQSPPPIISNIRRHNSVVLAPDQQMSLDSLTRLEIPSPGGFFSSLSPGSRNTWNLGSLEPQSEVPPSSTTAESFYKTPWAPTPIERIVEVSEVMSDGCPTARPAFTHYSSDDTVIDAQSHETIAAEEPVIATEILVDYDDNYVRELKDAGSENMDRTSMWLTAQTTFSPALINPPEERDDETALEKRNAEITKRAEEVKEIHERAVSPVKKVVRFSAMDTVNIISCPAPKQGPRESAYYRSFQKFVNRSRFRDIYVHRLPRFEAIQIERATFPEAHRNHLLGKYQLSVVPMSEKKKRESANVARGDETIEDDLEKLKSDKEHEAMEQMWGATWNVMAMKMLNGGRLIAAPVAKRLARLSQIGHTDNGTPRGRVRILDLGGQATCDWGWHVAAEYPNAKVYTVTTKASRQLSNSNIRGPKNHRQVAIEKLTKLPFNDNHFDLISARNVYSMLKIASENGEDEYDTCLAECMRCLKPGGFLEFSLIDSDIVNTGPRGQAKSVEFGFNLKTRGYDPTPTKAWLSRLNKAGFVSIKRAWMYLPMGAPLPKNPVSRDSMGVEIPFELEAMVTGSTNAAASITGLIGSWAWEKWMLKLELESGRTGESLSSVYDIIEEGRKLGAGWRSLSGWARKPLRK